MKVELLTSPASIKDMEKFTALAYLTCHANTEKEYEANEKLGRAIKDRHESVLEHINLTYSVKGLSRACLQELARHRHISLSVESTRHVLRKQLNAINVSTFTPPESVIAFDIPYKTLDNKKRHYINDYISFIKDEQFEVYPDDMLKYLLPEFWPTNLILTSNIRELRHILKLRTSPAALNEFRVLAYSLYEAVPEEYRYLLTDCVYQESAPNEADDATD